MNNSIARICSDVLISISVSEVSTGEKVNWHFK